MIALIDSNSAKKLLNGRKDIFSLKILNNLISYDGYDFFKVYAGKSILIGKYYRELIIRTENGISYEELCELVLFLRLFGGECVLCDEKTGEHLIKNGFDLCSVSVIYKFSPPEISGDEAFPAFDALRKNPPYDEVFSILKDGFPDIKYDDWYLDINHRVRHNTAEIYIYGKATVTITSKNDKAAFAAFLSTKNESKGKGEAKRLLRSLGSHFLKEEKDLFILCRQELRPFYEKVGFIEAGKALTVRI